MKINALMFRGYDLRGLVDKDLNPKIVEYIGRAYGTYLKRCHISRAVVSRDCRATSRDYSQAIIRGLGWAGVDTVDIGLNLVGSFYWSQYYLNCPGGVYVTASHNPVEYNGFKFALGFSETLVQAGIQDLRRIVETDDCEQGEKPGEASEQDIGEPYYSDLAKRFSFTKKFKVVVDPSCATAGVIVPLVLRKFGCEVIECNCNIDPNFPLGTPDPTEIVVAKRLSEEVLARQADIGFSYDTDGDRIGIADNQGKIIWNDVLVALFAMDVLWHHPGAKIMFNSLCSKMVPETIVKYGGEPFMWRTGHSFLKKKNQEVGAAFVGELSGHFFFAADFYNHDDGLYSTLRLLSYLARTDQTLAQALSALPSFISSPEIKVGCPDELKGDLIIKMTARLKADFKEAEIIDDERVGDGVRLDMPGAMFVVRYSQNGPYLVIKFEADRQDQYDQLKNYLNNLLHSYGEIDWQFGSNTESLE